MSIKMSMKNYNYGKMLQLLLFVIIIIVIAILLIVFVVNNKNKVRENYYDIDIKNEYSSLLEKKRTEIISDDSIILNNHIQKSKVLQTNLNDINNNITTAENQLYLLKNMNDNNIYTLTPEQNHLYKNSQAHYA